MAQRTRESEAARARLVGIFETTTDLVATARPDGRLLYLNQAGHSMLGLKESEDLSQTNLSQIMSPESQNRLFDEAIPTALQRGSWSGETLWLSRSGACIPASQVVIAHKSESGELEYLSLVARDISQIKQAEEAQREQRVLSDALRDTAAALNSTLHFEEVLDRILENVGRVMPHDVAHIMLIEGDVARIVRRRSNGTPGTCRTTASSGSTSIRSGGTNPLRTWRRRSRATSFAVLKRLLRCFSVPSRRCADGI
jgi:PAS domain S-box-containing protein